MAPAPARGLVKWLARRSLARRFWQSGIGRFNGDEIAVLGKRDVESLAEAIGDKSYLMGETPCAADAAVYATLTLLLDAGTNSPTRDAARAASNLVAYRDRVTRRYFPEAAHDLTEA